jgi:hypothetical protein
MSNNKQSTTNNKPHGFCETPEEKCTMNYCDENGCINRKRNPVGDGDPIDTSNNKQSSVDKEFVPYEEALVLKELGFDEPCFSKWLSSLQSNWKEYELILEMGMNEEFENNRNSYLLEGACSAPTFSQAFRWFREKYSLIGFVSTGFCPFPDEPKSKSGYRGFIKGIDERSLSSCNVFFRELETYCYKTYEEAELACLRKLIEIRKRGGNNEQQ